MNGSQPIQFSNFQAPKLEPIWAARSFIFLTLNILTVGIYGAAEKLSKQHRVKELKINQDDLNRQIYQLNQEWDALDYELSDLLQKFSTGSEDVYNQIGFKTDLEKLSAKNGTLQHMEIRADYKVAASIGEVALGTIAFLGQLLANIATLGMYGVFMNYSLNNKITILEAQNEHIQEKFNEQQNNRSEKVRNIIAFADSKLNEREDLEKMQSELDEIRQTPEGEAHAKQKKAEQSVAALQLKQGELQNDLRVLRIQKLNAEQGKKKVEADLGALQKDMQDVQGKNRDLADKERNLRREKDQLNLAVVQKDAEIIRKNRDFNDLQLQLQAARQKSADVVRLEREIARYKDANKYQPDVQKLQTELGPIDPLYTPSKTDKKEIPGAMDVDDNDDQLPKEWVDYAKEYKKRYPDTKRSAAEVIEASFGYAFDQLIEMADKGDKIKLNRSYETGATPGAYAIFRFMALDLLKGGKLTENGCHGLQIKINGNVNMLPSQPEKIMQYKDDQKGGLQPVVVVHHKLRDDFTPSEEAIGQNGVDPISAKWILEQLTEDEKNHLFNLLMEAVIENTHPDYIKTKDYMRNKHDPRVALVQKAYDLIADIGSAYQKKFGGTVFVKCWQTHTDDFDIEPFVKKDDLQPDLTKIVDTDLVSGPKGPTFEEWEFDPDVIGDKRSAQSKPTQEDFVTIITGAKFKYASFFENLDQNIIQTPDGKDKKFNQLEWKDVNKQYYVSHQMIGADQYFNGGQRCLFSNLLAVLVTEKKDLTDQNVYKMRKAMAAYLDKLQRKRDEWNVMLPTVPRKYVKGILVPEIDKLSPDARKLWEMAELARSFETAIMKTHKCTVGAYQLWLRNEPSGFIGGQWQYPAPVTISDLTQLEIQLCAYAFGVKIGVLPILTPYPTKTDEFGRLVPDGEFYGPNTEEFLLIGCTQGSYYGLFPKLHLPDGLEPDDNENLLELSNYWREIDADKNK